MSKAILNDLRGSDIVVGANEIEALEKAAVQAVMDEGEVFINPDMAVAIADELSRMRIALAWYGGEAMAAAIETAKQKPNPHELKAILTVLANDGGMRAGKALLVNQHG